MYIFTICIYIYMYINGVWTYKHILQTAMLMQQGTRLLIHADRIFWSCRTMGGRMRGSPRSCKRLVTEDSSRGYCIHNPPVIKHDIGTSSSMMFPFIILIPINPPIEFADFAMFDYLTGYGGNHGFPAEMPGATRLFGPFHQFPHLARGCAGATGSRSP